jgi:hypothetical protein
MFASVVWLFLCEEEKILGIFVLVEVLGAVGLLRLGFEITLSLFFVPQFQISREFA